MTPPRRTSGGLGIGLDPEASRTASLAARAASGPAFEAILSVRPYRPGDEAAMAALYNAAHGHLAGFVERTAERVRWSLSRPDLEPQGMAVAQRADRVAGYAIVSPEGDVLELAADPADAWPVTDALLVAAEAYVASRGGDRIAVLLPPEYAAHDRALWERGYGQRPAGLGQWIIVDAAAVIDAILREKLRTGAPLPVGRFVLRIARGLYANPLPPVLQIALSPGTVSVGIGSGGGDTTIHLTAEQLAEIVYGGRHPAVAWLGRHVRVRPWHRLARGLALLHALRVTDPWYFPMGDCR